MWFQSVDEAFDALPVSVEVAVRGACQWSVSQMACTISSVSLQHAQEQKQLQSLKKTRGLLHQLVDALHTKGGWPLSRLHLLGYSQGGTTALALHDLCELSRRCLHSSL